MQNGPRKVESVLDFIDKFETVLLSWPRDVKWPLTRIAEVAQTDLPLVLEFIEEALGKSIDIHDPLTHKEGQRALDQLKQRMRGEIEARRRRIDSHRRKTELAYEKIIEKVNNLQLEKNWYSAYRTLSYFFGVHEPYLEHEAVINICSECLRLGAKAGVNFQELAAWLQKGVEVSLGAATADAFEDALDFVDAYGEHFVSDDSGHGQKLIKVMLDRLAPPAVEMGLASKIESIIFDLNLGSSQDIR